MIEIVIKIRQEMEIAIEIVSVMVLVIVNVSVMVPQMVMVVHNLVEAETLIQSLKWFKTRLDGSTSGNGLIRLVNPTLFWGYFISSFFLPHNFLTSPV